MKAILLILTMLVCSGIKAQTSVSTTYDFVKKEYGVNMRHNWLISSFKNGAYKEQTDKVSVFEFGLGYAHRLYNDNSLFIIPTYNYYYNKSETFSFIDKDKFHNFSVEVGAEVKLNRHLIANIFFDPLMWEVRFGFGYEF